MPLVTVNASEIRPAAIGSRNVLRGRFIGTCDKCGTTSAFDGYMAEGRIDGRWKCGWASNAGAFHPFNQVSRADCACGKSVYGVELRLIQGRFVPDHKCGARCRNSKGPTCDCSCGGANHGQGFCH